MIYREKMKIAELKAIQKLSAPYNSINIHDIKRVMKKEFGENETIYDSPIPFMFRDSITYVEKYLYPFLKTGKIKVYYGDGITTGSRSSPSDFDSYHLLEDFTEIHFIKRVYGSSHEKYAIPKFVEIRSNPDFSVFEFTGGNEYGTDRLYISNGTRDVFIEEQEIRTDRHYLTKKLLPTMLAVINSGDCSVQGITAHKKPDANTELNQEYKDIISAYENTTDKFIKAISGRDLDYLKSWCSIDAKHLSTESCKKMYDALKNNTVHKSYFRALLKELSYEENKKYCTILTNAMLDEC